MQQAFGEFVICGGLSNPRFRRSNIKMQVATATEQEFEVKTMSDSTEVQEDYFKSTNPKGKKPKVVIIGAGWGGFNFGKFINKDEFEVVLISPRNHFLFTPLLPSTTVGTLEYKCI